MGDSGGRGGRRLLVRLGLGLHFRLTLPHSFPVALELLVELRFARRRRIFYVEVEGLDIREIVLGFGLNRRTVRGRRLGRAERTVVVGVETVIREYTQSGEWIFVGQRLSESGLMDCRLVGHQPFQRR